ncbi:MAG: phosphate transport system regulatory protein PhoU [Actinobacteria bacterium]|nr:MAG: phosphate transport system regulatory protein PhoU [Actinomycetota bacterium]
MRKTFHQELRDLRTEVLHMGQLVTEAIDDGVKALVEGDAALVEKVIAGDDEIDRLTMDVEEQGLALLARQAPVAIDLRLIHSMMFISVHLERMGDLALNIAKAARKTTVKEEGSAELLALISRMGELVHGVVDASLDAFDRKDCDLARKLPEMDEPIDQLFKQFFKELTKFTDEEKIDWASNMVLASRYLERIADHAVDIGERVCYLVTGEFQEFSDQD